MDTCAWCQVFGRDGYGLVANSSSFEAKLSALYLKLMDGHMRLEAWTSYKPLGDQRPGLQAGASRMGGTIGDNVTEAGAPLYRSPAGEPMVFTSISSRETLQPEVWYSIVATSDGHWTRLWINGRLEGMERAYGPLVMPHRPQDGGLTLGCGMFDGLAADTCSCIINEARVTNEVRPMESWLWSPDRHDIREGER